MQFLHVTEVRFETLEGKVKETGQWLISINPRYVISYTAHNTRPDHTCMIIAQCDETNAGPITVELKENPNAITRMIQLIDSHETVARGEKS